MEGYQLKIMIKGSSPPIWRRVIVPGKISFADLDDVIECIFGWEHEHMYEFYFQKKKAHIVMQDEFGEGIDANEACIDGWIGKGSKFEYTYDFGDNWKHMVVVEKLVPYEKRYASVVKFAGPNMIEDCGGIWGFYDCMDEAEKFDLDAVNERLKSMEFGKFEELAGVSLDDWEKRQRDEKDFFRKLFYDRIDTTKIPPLEISLEAVYAGYKKENLVTLAKLHGLKGYSKFTKKALAKWLADRLLDTAYMKQMFKSLSRDEMGHFETALEGGEYISEELVSESMFLCTYGAYNDLIGTIQIPKDVREQYQKICTSEFREEMEKEWRIVDYCDSAVYLYGIVPVRKLEEICRHYKEDITETAIYALSEDWEGRLGEGRIQGEFLMEEQFLEGELYQMVRREQGDISYYIPEDREEFLGYGREFCQEPDEHTESFITFLRDRYRMEYAHALTDFYIIQSAIRANYEIPELMEILDGILSNNDEKLEGMKKRKEAEGQLNNLLNYTRVIRYRGHTRKEYLHMQSIGQGKKGKVIAFPGSKKIYPNDPCPCGSGKKYKKCCGRNKN